MPEENMWTEFCERIDLNFSLHLQVDAPRGHPHLLNIKGYKPKEAKIPENLSLIDVLATIIFDWNSAALHHLLNMENEEFYCDADWEEDSLDDSTLEKPAKFVYIHRLGEYIRVAIVGTNSDSEISYRICNEGKWEMKSAQYRQRSECNEYYITGLPEYLDDCKEVEEEMAQDMAKRFLVEGILADTQFPVYNYMPQAESAKEKSDGWRSNKTKDVRLESSGGSSRVKSSDTLLEEESNVKLTKRKAQVLVPQNSTQERAGSSRKRNRED
ncbi:b0da1405-bc15-449d-8622-d2977aed915c [Sclerotinia trifoliorum]|uniref:B0da1405-bc15-449d-8622-d2977aed915c n=1 Tax=Sclerotinia trifoliorum TaxID=28548 RepID=A0A8H2VS81_9HELO|nr:b0da1405-bc15-449d-8622-d2977aed915c [Sclerotinia trifoliorum]